MLGQVSRLRLRAIPVGVDAPMHDGSRMKQLKNVFILTPLEANLIVKDLQP